MKDLDHYFEELKLKLIPEIYKKEAKIAAEKKLDYTEYLSGLIEKEYQGMIERSINQRIRRAGFPCIKTIEGYDFTHQPQLNEKLIRNLHLVLVNHTFLLVWGLKPVREGNVSSSILPRNLWIIWQKPN